MQRLHLLRTGNLVLVDALNLIKWQSFNFPTNVMLWGQRLSSRTRLTSFISNNNNNSSIFYSFEIQYDKIALYLNSGMWKYTYWEFKPSHDQQNITYVQLTSEALEIFSGTSQKLAEITSPNLQPLRFLALSNTSGDLGLYFYNKDKQGFQASYQALTTTCDFPLACKPYGICTFSNSCSCIRLITRETKSLSDCSEGIKQGLCGKNQAEMIELQGVTSVLRGIPSSSSNKKVINNRSQEQCAKSCLDNCTCVAALYSSNEADIHYKECFLYGTVRGVKQVGKDSKLVYMVKVPKGSDQTHGKNSGLKKWIVVFIGVVDGLIILVVLGGISYYFIQKRRKNLLHTEEDSSPP